MKENLVFYLILIGISILSCVDRSLSKTDKLVYDDYKFDGLINFYFFRDTLAPDNGEPYFYWSYGSSYSDSLVGKISFISSSYELKRINELCGTNITLSDSIYNIHTSTHFASRDSMTKLEKDIYYSDNIFSTHDKLIKTISLKVKGEGLLIENLCDKYLESFTHENCPGPINNEIPSSFFLAVKKIELIKPLNNAERSLENLSNSTLNFIELIFCD